MAIANTTIQLRKSGVTGNVPSTLNLGELALNYADGRLYYKNSLGTITYISSGATSNSFATINANSSLVIASSNTDILSIAPGNNITVTTNTTSKTITLGLSNNVTITGALTTSQYIQFSDGSKQYTANAGGAGSSDTIARNIAQASYDQANVVTGGLVSANANIALLQGAMTTANANIVFLQSINTTQNTNTTTANNAAWAAFVTANNALANTGTLVTSNTLTQYVIGNTAAAVSNTTGALQVTGGISTKGNIYSTGGSLTINNGLATTGNSGTIYLGDGSFTKTYGGSWTFAGGVSSTGSGFTAPGTPGPTYTGFNFSGTGQALYQPSTGVVGITANSVNAFMVSAPASSVNYLQVSGNTTGLNPYLSAQGSDANIGIRYDARGTSLHAFGANGNTSFAVYTSPTSVDYFQMSGSNAGFPVMQASGASANIGLTVLTKGTGGIFFKTGASDQQAQISATTSAVNYLNFTGAIATRSPTISVAGTDTDISLNLTSKAAGTINLNGVDVVGALSSNASLQSGINTTQNTNITTANNAAWAAYAAGNTNATNITAVNTYAGSAYAQANATAGGLVTANTNITTANNAAWSAYAAGNTSAAAITIIQGVDTGQNTRMTIIEGVDTGQNTRMTIIEGVDATQNTNITTANNAAWAAYAAGNTNATNITAVNTYAASAYSLANTHTTQISVIQGVDTGQNTFMQAAFNKANTSIQTTGDQTLTGNLTISKDLAVTGNLIVLGNTIAINTSSFTVVDSLITLGIGNYTTDVLDIGFAGHYNDGTNAHSGIIRDAGTKDWYIFKGYTPELNANNNVDINDASFRKANVNADYFKGNLIATTSYVNGLAVYEYITGAYGLANTHTTQISIIQGVDSTQNTNITTANNAAWAAYAAGNTNATNITAVNTYAGSAYASANLALGIDATQNTLITTANTTATTGNNAAQAAYTLANTHTTQISVIQGVDTGQNTRMTIIEGVDTTQNSRMTIIEGVDTTQNTNITTANTRAYNTVLKTGDVMTGALNIAVTTAATSLTTGALIVGGGLSVSGNAYSTAVYTNGLYYAANGLPISTGSAGGGSSFGTVSVLGSQTANIVAAASNTLLTFSAGSGVTITPYSSNNTVSIGILGGAQGVQLDWGLITDTFSAVTFDFGPSLV